jgi:hypothetical protein
MSYSLVKQPHPAKALGWLQSPRRWPGGAFQVPELIFCSLLKDPAGNVDDDDDVWTLHTNLGDSSFLGA